MITHQVASPSRTWSSAQDPSYGGSRSSHGGITHRFHNEYACIQEHVFYSVNTTTLQSTDVFLSGIINKYRKCHELLRKSPLVLAEILNLCRLILKEEKASASSSANYRWLHLTIEPFLTVAICFFPGASIV